MPEWSKYDCGTLPGRRGFSLKIPRELTEVFHVAHIDTALRIMKDNKIRSGLIGDKSKLKEERVAVTWLSPNEWFQGSRYGNIAFTYNFATLVKDKRYYWVEVMTEYTPDAPRILITNKEYDYLDEYNPQTARGPWKYDPITERHWWNGDVCLEFMLEQDLLLNRCKEIKAVKHHSTYCCIDPSTCKDKAKSELKAARKYYSSIVAQEIECYLKHHTIVNEDGSRVPRHSLYDGLTAIFLSLRDKEFSGNTRRSSVKAGALVRASLAALSVDNFDDFKIFLNEFRNEKSYLDALQDLIKDYFDLTRIEP